MENYSHVQQDVPLTGTLVLSGPAIVQILKVKLEIKTIDQTNISLIKLFHMYRLVSDRKPFGV